MKLDINTITITKTGEKQFTQALPEGYSCKFEAKTAEFCGRVVEFDPDTKKGIVIGQLGIYACEFEVRDDKSLWISKNTPLFMVPEKFVPFMPAMDPACAW